MTFKLVLGVGLVAQLVKNPPASAGDLGSIPELGRSPGEGKGYPLQYSDLENSIDCRVHGIAKSWTQLSKFHFTFTSVGNKSVKVCNKFILM